MDEDAHLEAAFEERTEIPDDGFEYLYSDPEEEYDDPPESNEWDPGPEVDDEGGMSEVRNQIRSEELTRVYREDMEEPF